MYPPGPFERVAPTVQASRIAVKDKGEISGFCWLRPPTYTLEHTMYVRSIVQLVLVNLESGGENRGQTLISLGV